MTKSQSINTLAYVSVALGIIGVLWAGNWFVSVAAIVTGHIAHFQIIQGKGSGTKWAIWGFVLGYVGILWGILVLLGLLAIFAAVA